MSKLTFEYNESIIVNSSVDLLLFYSIQHVGVTDGSLKGHVYFRYFS